MPNYIRTELKISEKRSCGVMNPNLKFWLRLSVYMEEVRTGVKH